MVVIAFDSNKVNKIVSMFPIPDSRFPIPDSRFAHSKFPINPLTFRLALCYCLI
ncbi:MAG: hypothetical protein F6K26_45560 [Moorea sp. SIO2I5]|nr:hypothetical protein [Moorena sp. SIO2I5]